MAMESTESIKRRMIQNASRAWGYPDSQDINSFDPVVGMILGALADELNKISGEIQQTDSRIIQKLLDLLFNQSHLTHFPAYGIVQATPTQPSVTISDDHQFTYRKRIENAQNRRGKPEERNIHFTPSGSFRLTKGQVKLFACGDQIYQVSDQSKEPVVVEHQSSIPDFGSLFIGLELDRNIEDLDGMILNFSLKNLPNEERFFRSIQGGSWFFNDQDIKFSQGLARALKQGVNSLEELFLQENDISYRACKFVNDLYSKQFIVLGDGKKMSMDKYNSTRAIPSQLLDNFDEAQLGKVVQDDLHWIKIVLAQPISTDTLTELLPSLNCFPVINRGRNEFTQSLRQGNNIIPLESEDNYYDIKQISDSRGKIYNPANSIGSGKSQKRSYILRQGGMARFDSRDALETIDHLTDLVRNEGAAFSILGTDMISAELKELDQIISRLKHRLETSSGNQGGTSSYILLNTDSGYERVHVEFWSTSGELANNIRAGSKLNVYRGRDINTNSVFMLNSTRGGKHSLSEEDKLNKLRRALLSKGRIVTREDIKALCFEHFGKDLSKVEIHNGVEAQTDPKKGLVQTLDIKLTLRKQHKLTEEDLIQKEAELKVLLRQGSINMVEYRIFIL